jgi:predicted nucleotidyltransferase
MSTPPNVQPKKGTDEKAVCTFVVEQAKEIFSDPTVIFFGSRARGTSRANSDFDFAIDAPKASQTQWAQFRDIVEQHAPTLLPIDLVDLGTEVEERLRRVIDDEGVVLIKKGKKPSKNQ